MLNKEWFHAEKYPFAAFEANDFEKQGEGQYIAHGFLTIKGTKVPVSLPFSLDITETGQQARRAEMEAQITLNRLDFKLGAGRWESADSVGLKVLVDIRVAATASD
jgi:polyisoprenoid-binding protein YceI